MERNSGDNDDANGGLSLNVSLFSYSFVVNNSLLRRINLSL